VPLYKVQRGDSPAIISRRLGMPVSALISANPQKQTQAVAGRLTWQTLSPGEALRVPSRGGTVGDEFSDAFRNLITTLMNTGGPCSKSNAPVVCAIQQFLGVTVDGKYGTNTATAARRVYTGAPAGCSPTPSWWVKGQSACDPRMTIPLPVPAPVPGVPAPPPSVSIPAAVAALRGISPCDPSSALAVCAAQSALGVKADGKYGNDTAAAARRVLGSAAPPACSPRPSWWAPVGQSNCTTARAAPTPPVPSLPAPPSETVIVVPQPPPVPEPARAPSAVLALSSFNPCDPANVQLVCQAQAALGFGPGRGMDGKYGNDTANAARRLIPNAPPACSPRPSWWAPTGRSNCDGAPPPIIDVPPPDVSPPPALPLPPITPPPATPPPPTTGPPATPPPATTPPSDTSVEVITPPADKKISTGAIVAGSVGAVAIAGLIALAASRSSSTTTSRTITRRAPRRNAPKRRAAKRSKKRKR